MKSALAVTAFFIQSIQNSRAVTQQCHGGKTCLPEEYCSPFSERCEKCSEICDPKSHNYNENDCQRYCAEMSNDDGIYSRIRGMQYQLNVIFILLIILLILVIISNGIKCIRWLTKRRSVIAFFKKVSSKKTKPTKVQAIGTISNVMHINETERPPSQIYSMTGMEGSTVLTVTTPVSTRYPAEDSTTPTEYSYDNAALQVTPSSDKPPLPGHI